MPNNIQQNPSDTRNIGHGRRRNNDGGTTPQRAKKAKTPPKANQPTPPQTNNIRIRAGKIKVQLFPSDQPVNRRMTLWEREQDLEDSKIWGRTPRSFIFDKHFYPECPAVSKYSVNFDLNAPY